MKKSIYFIVLMTCAFSLFAQNMDYSGANYKNVVKFLPINLVFHSISFEYERMINGRNSAIIGIGIPYQNPMGDNVGTAAQADFKSRDFGTMHIRAAYRHYTGKTQQAKGFYLEPYLKYQRIKGTAEISGVDDQTSQSYSGSLDAKLYSYNFGFQLGAQFLIAKKITVDLYFLGLEAGFLSGNANAITPNSQSASIIRTKVQEAVDDLPSGMSNHFTISQTGNVVNAKASNALYPWYRGGVSIGIAF